MNIAFGDARRVVYRAAIAISKLRFYHFGSHRRRRNRAAAAVRIELDVGNHAVRHLDIVLTIACMYIAYDYTRRVV